MAGKKLTESDLYAEYLELAYALDFANERIEELADDLKEARKRKRSVEKRKLKAVELHKELFGRAPLKHRR